jgi:nitrogen PTS system EIIA component
MDLKTQDVAELLNVSEEVVDQWIKEDKIPFYQLKGQQRFSRVEIEDWVISQKTQVQDQSSIKESTEFTESYKGSQSFSLYRAIHKGGIYHNVPGNTKEEVIRNAMQQIARQQDIDEEVITELLLDREKLMPTSLNHGIGVPHARDFLLDKAFDLIAIVFPEKPIEYGALDQKPVHTLFFLLANTDKRHLHLLAKIAHLCSTPNAIKELEKHPNSKDLLNFIKNWEISQHSPALV